MGHADEVDGTWVRLDYTHRSIITSGEGGWDIRWRRKKKRSCRERIRERKVDKVFQGYSAIKAKGRYLEHLCTQSVPARICLGLRKIWPRVRSIGRLSKGNT